MSGLRALAVLVTEGGRRARRAIGAACIFGGAVAVVAPAAVRQPLSGILVVAVAGVAGVGLATDRLRLVRVAGPAAGIMWAQTAFFEAPGGVVVLGVVLGRPAVFDRADTVTVLDEIPPADRPPDYPSPGPGG